MLSDQFADTTPVMAKKMSYGTIVNSSKLTTFPSSCTYKIPSDSQSPFYHVGSKYIAPVNTSANKVTSSKTLKQKLWFYHKFNLS